MLLGAGRDLNTASYQLNVKDSDGKTAHNSDSHVRKRFKIEVCCRTVE